MHSIKGNKFPKALGIAKVITSNRGQTQGLVKEFEIKDREENLFAGEISNSYYCDGIVQTAFQKM